MVTKKVVDLKILNEQIQMNLTNIYIYILNIWKSLWEPVIDGDGDYPISWNGDGWEWSFVAGAGMEVVNGLEPYVKLSSPSSFIIAFSVQSPQDVSSATGQVSKLND